MRDKSPFPQYIVAALLLFLFGAGIIGLGSLLSKRSPTATTVTEAAAARQSTPNRAVIPSSPAPRRVATTAANVRSTAAHPTLQQVIAYGSGEAALGMERVAEQEPIGPESFAVAKNGNVLVADVAKHRLAIYSRDGEFLRSISLPGVALGDVATDNQGRICVYDQVTHTLYQYDADGTARSTLALNPKDIDTRGYFHIVGNAVYFADAAMRDVLVGTLQDSGLVLAGSAGSLVSDGIHAESGRIYSLSLDREHSMQVVVNDAKGQSRAVAVPLQGIVSARFAGEDDAGRFYIQTERVDNGRIALEVLTFSAGGDLLASTSLPENDYAIWTTKLVDVRNDGTIVQFLPQKNQARLNLFTN